MVGVQELLVAVANTPVNTPVVVDVAGNGKALMPIESVEVREGKLVIACEAPKSAQKPEKPTKTEKKPAKPVASDEDNIELK